jgi:hypothetical protein
MAVALLLGNGSKFLKNIWADEITGTEGDDNLVGTINADIINGLGGHDSQLSLQCSHSSSILRILKLNHLRSLVTL